MAAQRVAPRREGGDGEQKIGGLRRVGRIGNGLRCPLWRQNGHNGIPSFQLAIEEGATRGVIGEREQVAVEAGNEGAVRSDCPAPAGAA